MPLRSSSPTEGLEGLKQTATGGGYCISMSKQIKRSDTFNIVHGLHFAVNTSRRLLWIADHADCDSWELFIRTNDMTPPHLCSFVVRFVARSLRSRLCFILDSYLYLTSGWKAV